MDAYEKQREINKAKFFEGAVGLIEATDFEQFCLWERWHNNKEGHALTWVGQGQGWFDYAGYLGEKPVTISFWTATISGKKVVFYNAVSVVVDHDMVREYLEKNMPDTARRNGKLNHTDANNAHIVFHSLDA